MNIGAAHLCPPLHIQKGRLQMGILTFDTPGPGRQRRGGYVLVALVDMQGRPRWAKRFTSRILIDHFPRAKHTAALFAGDRSGDVTPEGFASTSWETGYWAIYVLRPDLFGTMCHVGLAGQKNRAGALAIVLDHQHP